MISQNSIGYYGFAELSFYRGKDKVRTIRIKNNGTNLLFKYLSQAICGLSVGSYMPKYFDMGNFSSDQQGNGIFTSNLSSRPVLTASIVENISLNSDQVAQVASKFTATIPSRTVSSLQEGQDNKINCLRLYNTYYSANNNDGLLAQIDLSDNPIEIDNNSYTIIVEWIMTFGNVIKSVQEG